MRNVLAKSLSAVLYLAWLVCSVLECKYEAIDRVMFVAK